MISLNRLYHPFEVVTRNRFYWLCFLMLLFQPGYSHAQQVRSLFEKLSDSFREKNFYTTINLCREVITICEKTPEPECWYTNIMKEVYRFKGISEFEIYKQELKKKRLADAIQSLTVSYNLYKDPEVQFLNGYLSALKAIADDDRTDLSGLITAWNALLNLYAKNEWKISDDFIAKTKLFIRVSEKFSEPIPSKKYTGVFAKFIILMACDLAEKDNLPNSEQKYFEEIRSKYFHEDGIEWQRWRSNQFNPK